jgi:hypothetical protein
MAQTLPPNLDPRSLLPNVIVGFSKMDRYDAPTFFCGTFDRMRL